jgi:hypothetical protein
MLGIGGGMTPTCSLMIKGLLQAGPVPLPIGPQNSLVLRWEMDYKLDPPEPAAPELGFDAELDRFIDLLDYPEQ